VLVVHADAPARLRVGLPPDLAATLRVGQAASVETGGRSLDATLRQIRPDLDPATLGRSVVLDLPRGAAAVPGDTATLLLTQRVQEPGFWVPLSALRAGVRGSWSVLAIDTGPGGDRVVPVAVEVIHVEAAQVFLRGALPPDARIVAEAPDRVAPGQIVLALAE
jgi:hypothetical protein